MKCYIIIVTFIVLITSDFVRPRSHERRGATLYPYDVITSTPKDPSINHRNGIPTFGVYLMGITIALLFFIIIGLLIIVYKLKRKLNCEHVDDKIEIVNTDASSKYVRQLSSDSNDITFSRENNNDDNRFKLTRQGSKMTIVDYPISFDKNEKKSEEPHTSTTTLNKVVNQQLVQLQREQMRKICEGVLSKKQRNECTSLSNLDKILNEDVKSKDSEDIDKVTIDKSASSPLLDVAENFESLSSTSSKKKINELSDYTPNNSNISNVKNEILNVQFRLPKICHNQPVDKSVGDDLSDDSNEESLDDVYDNPPNINRPVLNTNADDEHLDDVYDNPSNINRPVTNIIVDYLEDIYDNVPTKIPVFSNKADNAHLNDLYDHPQRNKIDKISHSLSPHIKKKTCKSGEDDEYDRPQNTGIVFEDDKDTGYVLAFTNVKETCFDSDYMNAKSLNKSK